MKRDLDLESEDEFEFFTVEKSLTYSPWVSISSTAINWVFKNHYSVWCECWLFFSWSRYVEAGQSASTQEVI